MERRSFLKGLGALMVAPAIVKVDSIMRINPRLVEARWHHVVGSASQVSVDGMVFPGKMVIEDGYMFSCWVKTEHLTKKVLADAFDVGQQLFESNRVLIHKTRMRAIAIEQGYKPFPEIEYPPAIDYSISVRTDAIADYTIKPVPPTSRFDLGEAEYHRINQDEQMHTIKGNEDGRTHKIEQVVPGIDITIRDEDAILRQAAKRYVAESAHVKAGDDIRDIVAKDTSPPVAFAALDRTFKKG